MQFKHCWFTDADNACTGIHSMWTAQGKMGVVWNDFSLTFKCKVPTVCVKLTLHIIIAWAFGCMGEIIVITVIRAYWNNWGILKGQLLY